MLRKLKIILAKNPNSFVLLSLGTRTEFELSSDAACFPEFIPASIPELIPEPIPELIPEFIPDLIPELMPELIPEMMNSSLRLIPELIPEFIPELIPELIIPELIPEFTRLKLIFFVKSDGLEIGQSEYVWYLVGVSWNPFKCFFIAIK